ncbi:MAG: endonuclease [Gammaproteobacteria bacterium]|nr:endonuclease [Gammaproteobacteria bacterium]
MRRLYRRLLDSYGPQGWWPARGPTEVLIGAVLTQHTSWRNVEQALLRLRAVSRLTPAAVLAIAPEELARLIHPAGYPRVKAHRLRQLLSWCHARGGVAALRHLPTDTLRSELLGVHGVGPETADSILLYALQRPLFVVDAYTRRLFSRLGLIGGAEHYDAIRRPVERALRGATQDLNEFHALIVRHGKEPCRPRPHCAACQLVKICRYPVSLRPHD